MQTSVWLSLDHKHLLAEVDRRQMTCERCPHTGTSQILARLSCVEALQSALEMDRALDLDGEAFVGRAICEFVEELKT